jgi:Domain of unknown function (DUF4136)
MYRRTIALFVLATLAAACAAPQTIIDSTDVAALSAASTFAINPPPVDTTGAATPHEGTRLRAAIEGEITRALTGKGYHLADPQSADLLVTYRLVSMGRVQRNEREDVVAESRVRSGPGDPYGAYQPLPETAAGERREMLLVTIADRKSATIVWQATNEGLATGTASAVGEVTGAARGALAKVPPSRRERP